MAKILPHSAKIRSDVSSYLGEVGQIVSACTAKVKASADYRNIYKTCLATDSVLAKLSARERPRLSAARGLIQRVPFLVATGQVPATRSELRRFLEVVFWCIYFSDHPVEWTAFSGDPTHRFEKGMSKPIAFCAFRERAFYGNYAQELLQTEPSGLAVDAAKRLSDICNALNAQVHAAHVAVSHELRPAWDSLTTAELRSIAKTQRDACASSCIVLAAYFAQRFDRLPPVHRAWFDWLVGSAVAKKVRSGPFGLRR